MNYKNTLNLPQTSFSMKANLINQEPKILELWSKLNLYEELRKRHAQDKKFILHDGPPYANGDIHMGHAFNKILKDIILKYKSLSGFDTPFIPGWDCHGLPVEHQLFKELKSNKHDVNIVEFRKKAHDFALRFVNLQKKDFIRLGVLADWENPYLTLNPEYEYAVMKLLADLVKEGFIYRDLRSVNWCGCCETALAEAEVEYLDKSSDSIYFLFSVLEGKGVLNTPASFLVWTTTPWTLVSNVAVALHPEYEYSLVEYNGKNILVCKDLISVLEKKFSVSFKVEKQYLGKDLEGVILKHPFLDRNSPVVLADYVSSQEGSGAVHIAPGHGAEDFLVGKKYNLPIIMPVNEKACFVEPQQFKGKFVKDVNQEVLIILKEKNVLVKHEKITHSYPHCWRCKQPIIFRATDQWFLNVDHKNLREKVLSEVDKLNWVPSSGKERMKAMFAQRPDWCLSRQRLWGVPIPALKCKECGDVFLDKDVVDKVAKLFKTQGCNVWFTQPADYFLPQGYKCKKCSANVFDKEFDILDVWFESGASFFAVLGQNKSLNFPADMYLEGSDQHRGWFQVSLIPSVAKEGVSPFLENLTHGFVVDKDGKKMSKSLGNVIFPQEIMKKYGAEILRLWVAFSDYSEDIKISDEIVSQLVDMYRKVRNTIRFIMGNIHDFKLEHSEICYEDLLEVDKYMLARLTQFFQQTRQEYEQYRFYRVCQKIFHFCNIDLSSFYLDILKDRLYTFSAKSKERQSAQYVLSQILKVLIKIISPILTFTAEEAFLAWQEMSKNEQSVLFTTFDSDVNEHWLNDNLLAVWEKIFLLRDQIYKELENKREAGCFGSSLEATVTVSARGEEFKLYISQVEALKEICIVSNLIFKEGDFNIVVDKAQGQKCSRCWHVREDLGVNKDYPDVCARCSQALLKNGG